MSCGHSVDDGHCLMFVLTLNSTFTFYCDNAVQMWPIKYDRIPCSVLPPYSLLGILLGNHLKYKYDYGPRVKFTKGKYCAG